MFAVSGYFARNEKALNRQSQTTMAIKLAMPRIYKPYTPLKTNMDPKNDDF